MEERGEGDGEGERTHKTQAIGCDGLSCERVCCHFDLVLQSCEEVSVVSLKNEWKRCLNCHLQCRSHTPINA